MMENKKELVGKEIKCKECGYVFIFADYEQKWYKEKGYPDPKRCYRCRQARKRESENK